MVNVTENPNRVTNTKREYLATDIRTSVQMDTRAVTTIRYWTSRHQNSPEDDLGGDDVHNGGDDGDGDGDGDGSGVRYPI